MCMGGASIPLHTLGVGYELRLCMQKAPASVPAMFSEKHQVVNDVGKMLLLACDPGDLLLIGVDSTEVAGPVV